LYLHMEASQHSLLAACFTLHSINATLAIVPQRGAGLWIGGAIAQAVRRWLPTAAARFRVREACGVCGGQGGTRAGFLRVLRFPLPIIPPISPSS
jgi:hypothetical protein